MSRKPAAAAAAAAAEDVMREVSGMWTAARLFPGWTEWHTCEWRKKNSVVQSETADRPRQSEFWMNTETKGSWAGGSRACGLKRFNRKKEGGEKKSLILVKSFKIKRASIDLKKRKSKNLQQSFKKKLDAFLDKCLRSCLTRENVSETGDIVRNKWTKIVLGGGGGGKKINQRTHNL